MEDSGKNPEIVKHETVKRPMNAFLIFCKRHRAIVHEMNPNHDNRSVTRRLGELWATLPPNEKYMYTELAKQYKEAFLKANPDYKWYNPEKHTAQMMLSGKPSESSVFQNAILDSISSGKLADPSNMGGLSMLLMAGQQTLGGQSGSQLYGQPGDQLGGHFTDQPVGQPQMTDLKMVSTQQRVSRLNVADGDLLLLSNCNSETFDINRKYGDARRKNETSQSLLNADIDQEIKSVEENRLKLNCHLIRTEDDVTLRMKNIERPMDISHSDDQSAVSTQCSNSQSNCSLYSIQSLNIKSQPSLIAGHIHEKEHQVGTSSNWSELVSTTRKEKDLNASMDVTWSIMGNLLSTKHFGRDNLTPVSSKCEGQGQGEVSRSALNTDIPLPPASLAVEATNSKPVYFEGPLSYLFSQPTNLISNPKLPCTAAANQLMGIFANQPIAIKPLNHPENSSVPATRLNSNEVKVTEDCKDSQLTKITGNDLRKLIVEKVIEAVYSKELKREPCFAAFPKTKKQMAIDKLSAVNRLVTSDIKTEGNGDTTSVERTPTLFASTVDDAVGNRKGVAMTVEEMNNKLIMKVVQEEEEIATNCPPQIGESRLPLKLQKKFQKLGTTEKVLLSSSSSSSSLVSSSSFVPLASLSSPLYGFPSFVFSNQLHLSCNVISVGGPEGKVNHTPNFFSNPLLMTNCPQFMQNRSHLSTDMGSIPVVDQPSAKSLKIKEISHSTVNEMIETIISESFPNHKKDKSNDHLLCLQNVNSEKLNENESSMNSLSLPVLCRTTDGVKTARRRCRKNLLSAEFGNSKDINVKRLKMEYVDNKPAASNEHSRNQFYEEPSATASTTTKFMQEISDLLINLDGTSTVAIKQDVSQIDFLTEKSLRTEEKIKEEINNNNNSRNKSEINGNVAERKVPLKNKGLRKSKRCNRGQRYKELMSQGILHASRKSLDSSNNLDDDDRDGIDDVKDIEGCDDDTFYQNGELEILRKRASADCNMLDADVESGRRYKSGDFDLEAHIASLPVCQIEMAERKSAAKVKFRTHSQTMALLSRQNRDIEMKTEEKKNSELKFVTLGELEILTRIYQPLTKNKLFGSLRRKARNHLIVQFLPFDFFTCGMSTQTHGISTGASNASNKSNFHNSQTSCNNQSHASLLRNLNLQAPAIMMAPPGERSCNLLVALANAAMSDTHSDGAACFS